MASYLITGANRGLGLLMVSFLASKPASEVRLIIAAARKSSTELDKLVADSNLASKPTVIALNLSVAQDTSVGAFADEVAKVLGSSGLDVLINNAGVLYYSSDPKAPMETMDNLFQHWEVNVNGVHLVSKALLPLLRQGWKKTIVNVSSAMSSITRAREFMFQPCPAYKITKAAMNMMTVQYASYLEPEGFVVFNIDPGWARTEMGSQHADLDPKESAECLITKVLSATSQDNGKFFDANVPSWEYKGGPNRYNGQIIPW
ncbi:hypothetical protein AYL99_08146 [Fonsecaea erecta]|uniref:Short chain oxidoreductase n=1 Tax=Fonsecaea erecta TaxID=1367422 RepID=A0A178ZCC5_9EURO|nr:hypothetical protein AYL99_08146 [Fonsecaea erecta]OAP57408.1 hypothetical protein AYL99_08146 [Fonsecaea erecta]